MDANSVSLPRPVYEIMNHWVLQMGFPVVTIDTTTGKVSQKHFLLDPESNVTVESPYKYATQLPHESLHFKWLTLFLTSEWCCETAGLIYSLSCLPLCFLLTFHLNLPRSWIKLNVFSHLAMSGWFLLGGWCPVRPREISGGWWKRKVCDNMLVICNADKTCI